MGIIAGYLFVGCILIGIGWTILKVAGAFEDDEEPAKLPYHDPYLIEMPHKYHFRNRWLRHKKGCSRCIQQAEIELGWIEEPKRVIPKPPGGNGGGSPILTPNEQRAMKGLGRGVGEPDDDGYIFS